MKPEHVHLAEIELYAWLGEDELGSGKIGLKQGIVPAGIIAMVSIERGKLEKYWPQAEAQAGHYGKRIYFCRFQMVEVVRETEAGS